MIWSRQVALCAVVLAGIAGVMTAQQVADTSFRPPIRKPAYAEGQGPVVGVDEGHYNFHTTGGRYQPFAELLRRDGYVVRPLTSKFTPKLLAGVRILVISNALHERNQKDWSLPNPSAFSGDEIAAVRDWVKGRGSLLLIADHQPFAGAAADLAAAFGLRWQNGYVVDGSQRGPLKFRIEDGSLSRHPITEGRTLEERVSQVATFTGSAFRADQKVEGLLILSPTAVSRTPTAPKQKWEEWAVTPVGGSFQGAVTRFGRGRLAAFGEAAMFSAQVAGAEKSPMGMNHPDARDNAQFLLNLMHWLTGLL
ncbi:MAG: DUF4350 domain-containing protein [Acidobacteriota bacterium]